MANAERAAGKSAASRIIGLVNPIRDPSLLVAIILTVIIEAGANDSPPKWLLFGVLIWMAVKGIIWLLVNLAFSSVFLLRKALWMFRNPRLAWRLLDALGTEEIIIGGLRPDMFANEDGSLHEGQLGMAAMVGAYGAPYAGALGAAGFGGDAAYDEGYQAGYQEAFARQPQPSMRLDAQGEQTREMLSAYGRLIADWMAFTEEKWRAVSDSQLGWKPLRGRWNGWEEIYHDSFAADELQATPAVDAMQRRFDNAQAKGSAASSVACFMRDLDSLRQSLVLLEGGDQDALPRMGGIESRPQVSQRSAKSPIIRNPMIVDADR